MYYCSFKMHFKVSTNATAGRLKTRDRKTQDWKTRENCRGLENAGLEISGTILGTRKRETGKLGKSVGAWKTQGWKTRESCWDEHENAKSFVCCHLSLLIRVLLHVALSRKIMFLGPSLKIFCINLFRIQSIQRYLLIRSFTAFCATDMILQCLNSFSFNLTTMFLA